jgi:hypothetical protein
LTLWDDFGPGARIVPLFAALTLVIFGAAVALTGGGSIETMGREALAQLGLYVLLLLVCVGLFPRLGALAAFLAFVIPELILVQKYTLTRACVVSVLVVGGIYLIFSVGLQMRLPPFPLWR